MYIQKRWLAMVLVFSIVLAFSACGNQIGSSEALDRNGWNVEYLDECGELTPREDISFINSTRIANGVEMVFKNNSDTDIMYDGWPGLQVKLDGKWYYVPYRPDVSHTAELKCIRAGETVTEALSLLVYPSLPAGEYRAVMFGHAVDVTIYSSSNKLF